MNCFPADERRISDVERGRSCEAVVPMPPGESLSAGDSVLFAQVLSKAGREPSYIKGGDSVRVLLTDVTDLEATDPDTGQALFQLTWEPMGQGGPLAPTSKRVAKCR